MMDADYLYLPPGFRFHPTDEEIITHYLLEKIADRNFSPVAIGEANFNDCEPWDLPSKAKMGEKEWYFFCEKDRKYPTGMRTNRATESGYWKATGKDKEISKGKRVLIGMKKTLVFYKGRAPKGQKTNWVMHEYRLEDKHHENYNLSISPKDKWVVCKVRHKLKDTKMNPAQELATRMNSFVDALFVENPANPPLLDFTYFNSINKGVEGSQGMENEFSKSIFSSQTDTLIPCFLHQGETMRAPLFSNQAASAPRGPCKLEQSSNSIVISASQDTGLSTERNTEASSAVSKHQISTLHSYDDDPSSGVEALDFDSILKYEFE